MRVFKVHAAAADGPGLPPCMLCIALCCVAVYLCQPGALIGRTTYRHNAAHAVRLSRCVVLLAAVCVCATPQVPFTDGTAFLLDNLKRRPLVVVRAVMAGLHDALRGCVREGGRKVMS